MFHFMLSGMERFLILDQRLSRFVDSARALPKWAVRAIGPYMEDEVKSMIGTYQPAVPGPVGTYPAWAQLTPATLERRRVRGINPADEPLKETQAMYNAVNHETIRAIEKPVVIVGYLITPETIQVDGKDGTYPAYHEIGTVDMPPRPTLGPALMKMKDKVEDILGPLVFNHVNILIK
jgi:hypothetical protein